MNDQTVLAVTFSDGNLYGIPVETIAANRAHVLAGNVGNMYSEEWWEEYDKVYTQTVESEQELIEWSRGNIEWSEVEQEAIMLFSEEATNAYAREWTNAEMSIVTVFFADEADTDG